MAKKLTLIKNGDKDFDLLCDVMNAGFEKGMSQTDIACKSNQNPVTLSAWVNGRGKPSLRSLLKLAEATGYSLRDVLAANEFCSLDDVPPAV